jgi:flagellar hook-associated protein 2
MSLSPLTITGVSQFSSDLQTIMTRATQIAQIPITQLQNQDSDTIQKKTLLSGISGAVSGLASSLESLGTAAANKALGATSSQPSVVSVVSSNATDAVSYTIDSVSSVATSASERTLTSYADSASTPVGSTGDFRLTAGSNTYDFTLADNNLVALRDKINSLGAGVTASILTTSDGNYLSVSANFTGATTLSLTDDPNGANTNLLTAANQGTDLEFKLNGITIKQSRNLVNSVIPGVTLNVLDKSADPVQITLASDRSQLSSALSSFVSNFNALRQQLNAQQGPSAGLLSGNSLVLQLSALQREMASQRLPDGSVRSLADLGVTFDTSGQMQFDLTKLNGLTDDQISDAFKFLGNSAEGLGNYAASLRQFSDPISGLIKTEQDGLDRVDQSLQDQISKLTDRANVMQKGLATKLQQADALLAALQSQQNMVTASLQGLNSVLYGKTNTTGA